MLQERELVPLMKELLEDGYRVLLETSGERPLGKFPEEVIKIVDVKCPHSGEPDTFLIENLATLTAHDEVKFVLSRPNRLRVRPRVHSAAQSGRARELPSCFRPRSAKMPRERGTVRTACSIPRN